MNRVILTAVSSGSGKTTITCGLLKELKDRGTSVVSYKCGPDYIDPMFHKKVLGIPSENLDLFFSDADYIKNILHRNEDHDIAVIEGAMGIYDGIIGLSKEGSVYDLAEKTNTPIVLIVDAAGIGATLVSIIKGILLDDDKKLIKGVVLNRISEHYYSVISPMIEKETGLKVLGYARRLKDISFDSRHLGLKLPTEIVKIECQLEKIREEIAATVDVDGILAIAQCANEITLIEHASAKSVHVLQSDNKDSKLHNLRLNDATLGERRPRLAVAMDEAFCFYYEDNLRVLRDSGAELIFFSPIHDDKLPENISGLLLGGGYPELKLNELVVNVSMKESIKHALNNGMPSLAECGGFMYLHDYIESEDGISYQMVGAVKGSCSNTGHLCRFGYVNLNIGGYAVKGHEFHYYDSTNNGNCGIATKPGTGKSWKFGYFESAECLGNGYYGINKLWGFPHLYYGSCPEMINDFVSAMKKWS